MDFLFRLDDADLFLLVVSVLVGLGLIGVMITKFCIPHEIRVRDNAVIGNVGSLIGLIYGVLAGLTALYLINNLSATADAVQREADSVANMYRETLWLKNPTQDKIVADLKEYLHLVISVEWPLMENGEELDKKGEGIISRISDELRNYQATTPTEVMILQNLISEMKALYDAREERVSMNSSQLSIEIWEVILIGTALTIGINFLFGMNIYLHLIVVAAASIMASSMIFLLLTLDRPFQGEFVIQADSYREVLTNINKNNPVSPIPATPPALVPLHKTP